MRLVRSIGVLSGFALVAACGGGGGPSPSAGPTTAAATTSTRAPGSTTAATTGPSSSAASTTAPAVSDGAALPAAATDPGGDPDAAAVALATATTAGGPGGAAAMLRALERSGIGVTDLGSVVRPAGSPSQGLLVAAGDVLAMSELFPDPNVVSLDLLMQNVAGVLGAPADADVTPAADAVLAALRGFADGTEPSLRFFARYLAALAAPSTTGDLLAVPDGRDVVLSGPQAMLLLYRIAGDVEIRGRSGTGGGVPRGTHAVGAPAQKPDPCQFDSYVLDTGTTAMNMALSKALDILESLGSSVEAFSGGMTKAGLIVSLLKLLATAALFQAKVELLDPPLRRVIGPGNPGEKRQLRATLEFKPNPAVWANCLAPALALFNAGMQLPKSGPVKGGRAMWTGTEGFATGTGLGYVEFYRLDDTLPTGPKGALVSQTDENGQARIGIEGTAPKTERPKWAPEYLRPVSVYVALDARETDVYRNILSAVSQLTNSVAQPILDAAINGLIGMGVLSRGLRFRIIDRAPDVDVAMKVGALSLDGKLCNGSGAVTLSGTDTSSGAPITANGGFNLDLDLTGRGTFTYDATYALDPKAGLPVTAKIEVYGSGDAQIEVSGDNQVSIALSNITSGGTGSGAGQGTSLNLGLPTDSGGNQTLTGTAGISCE